LNPNSQNGPGLGQKQDPQTFSEKHLSIVDRLSKRAYFKNWKLLYPAFDEDDIIQWGRELVFTDKFDATKSTFEQRANFLINRRIVDLIRDENGRHHRVSKIYLDELINDSSGSQTKHVDLLRDKKSKDSETSVIVQSLLDTLPQRSKEIVILYFWTGRTLKEIADIFGVSESRICQIMDESLTLLRKGGDKMGWPKGKKRGPKKKENQQVVKKKVSAKRGKKLDTTRQKKLSTLDATTVLTYSYVVNCPCGLTHTITVGGFNVNLPSRKLPPIEQPEGRKEDGGRDTGTGEGVQTSGLVFLPAGDGDGAESQE
jgi:RNA polymerase sigma factor (sigma-70 family)